MRFVICVSMNESAIAGHMAALAGELVRRGHDAAVVSWGNNSGLSADSLEPSIALHHFPSPRPTGIRDFKFLRDFLSGRNADCVIAHFGAVNVAVLAGALSGVRRRVAWCHTLSRQIELDSQLPAWRQRLLTWRKCAVYRFATHLVANTSSTAHDMTEHFRVPREKIRVLPYALRDPLDGAPEPGVCKNAHILCVGRLHTSKGQDVLLEAVARLHGRIPRLSVTLAGDGPRRAFLSGKARELGIAECIEFAGAVPREEILRMMAAATVTTVPSRSEAFGLVNVESMSVGTPVVASRVGGIPEIIRDGLDGYLVPPDDAEALAAALERLLGNPALRLEMSRNARERFLSEFELSTAALKHATIIEEIAS